MTSALPPSGSSTSPAPPAGWYTVPNGEMQWWDGVQWIVRSTDPVPGGRESFPRLPDAAEAQGVPRRSWTRARIVSVVAVALVAGGVSAFAIVRPHLASADASSVTASGTMQFLGVYGLDSVGTPTTVQADSSGGCVGVGGYSDLTEGATVTVYDAGGEIVGTGSLGAGEYVSMRNEEDIQAGAGRCAFAFSLAVPDSDFYQVEVTHRGRVTVQRAEVGQIRLEL